MGYLGLYTCEIVELCQAQSKIQKIEHVTPIVDLTQMQFVTQDAIFFKKNQVVIENRG